MIKVDIRLPLEYSASDIIGAVCRVLPIDKDEIRDVMLLKRTLVISDKSDIHYTATVAFSASDGRETGLLKMRKKVSYYEPFDTSVPQYRHSTRPVVVGAGPAGLFCALALAESGARPILYERGLDIDTRDAKVSTFRLTGLLDPECNVQYGEGGAGTYSDGKLKVGGMDKYKMKVLSTFVECGADDEILYSVGAHVGTDVLSGVIRRLRERLISLGADIRFGARLTDIRLRDGAVVGGRVLVGHSYEDFETDTLIVAAGHSARDTFELLYKSGAPMQSRGFGIGMRIEHPREYINEIVYGKNYPSALGTASYHLVTHLPSGRSVYSFCMCPGGVVVPAASEQGGIVTNGMSEHARMADNSNAALLVSVTPDDFGADDVFAGLRLQRAIEQRAFTLAGADYSAPATSLSSLTDGTSPHLASVKPSYARGTSLISHTDYFPDFVTDSIKAAMPDFDAWLPGYAYPDAALTGPETRTTSPIRILRDDRTLEVLGIDGLYAAGEGAGYSGGIVSSARDGLMIAEAAILKQSGHK